MKVKSEKATRLDLDLVIVILGEKFPASNKWDNDLYGELMADLKFFNIITDEDFRELLDQQAIYVKQREAEILKNTDPAEFSEDNAKRIKSGVLLSWIGLARAALRGKAGEKLWFRYMPHYSAYASSRDTYRAKTRRPKTLDS